LFRADSGEEKIVSLEMELKVVGENMKQMEVNIISNYPCIILKGKGPSTPPPPTSNLHIIHIADFTPNKFLNYFGLCFRFVICTTMDKI
jgi:hypothetical protein